MADPEPTLATAEPAERAPARGREGEATTTAGPSPARDDAALGLDSAGSTLGALAGPVALVLLAGLAMPPHQGWLLPMGLILGMAIVGERRLRRLATLGPAPAAGHPAARLVLLLAALGSITVLLTVLARGVGALAVEIPASLWGAGAAVLAAIAWALIGRRLPLRARPVVLGLVILAIPWAGVVGTRYEAAGPYARGWAHSGPILGIHPFQTTAILVDGHGPFDLPINDYVEPDGARGYGPEALADALDRALASIAERVYPQGPARIRRALVDAEVEAVTTPGVWERLDRPPTEETQPRFVVRSGSFGRGSRVEFVCPGRRIDPRGPLGETVMNRMCPDKYASEASAGLGVTGRWSGYSEARGQDRVGLHQWLGLTRSNDAEGRRALERETHAWAWIVLAVVGLAVILRPATAGAGEGLRAVGRGTGRVGEGLRDVAGALGTLAVVVLVLAVVAGPGIGEPLVGALPAGPSWMEGPSLAAWAPALALGSLPLYALDRAARSDGSSRFDGSSRSDEGASRARIAALAVPAVLVLVSTVALATSLPALAWIFPVHGAEGATLPAFVRGVAEALGERAGLTIFEVEGAVASSLAGLLLGAAVATAGAGLAATGRLAGKAMHGPPAATVVALVLGVAALLVVSRKTAGAAALVPGVVGTTLVLGSALTRLAERSGSDARAAGGSPGVILGAIAPLGWMAVGAALVWAAVDPLPSHPFVTLCTVLGLLAVGGAGVAGAAGTRARPQSRSDA